MKDGTEMDSGGKIKKAADAAGWKVLKKSTRRDSNPRPSPWQGDTPPLSHSCKMCCILSTFFIIHHHAANVKRKFKLFLKNL